LDSNVTAPANGQTPLKRATMVNDIASSNNSSDAAPAKTEKNMSTLEAGSFEETRKLNHASQRANSAEESYDDKRHCEFEQL